MEAVLKRLPPQGRVWDLGTGSGAIAVTVALERVDADVRASDISVGALDTARQNAAKLGAKVEFAQGSWFDTDRPSEDQYDVIVSNPPYIENGDEHLSQGDLRFEPQNALTDFSDGLSHIRHIIQEAPKYLKLTAGCCLNTAMTKAKRCGTLCWRTVLSKWQPNRIWLDWTGSRWGVCLLSGHGLSEYKKGRVDHALLVFWFVCSDGLV